MAVYDDKKNFFKKNANVDQKTKEKDVVEDEDNKEDDKDDDHIYDFGISTLKFHYEKVRLNVLSDKPGAREGATMIEFDKFLYVYGGSGL
jgi:hypothetical protein